jgi:hypothetical protein
VNLELGIVEKPDKTQYVVLSAAADDGTLAATIVMRPDVAHKIGLGIVAAADSCRVLSISTTMPRGESGVN